MHRRGRFPAGARDGRCSEPQGKILIDLANPLDFSHGMPPSLAVCNTYSLGEEIQRAFPETKVVKTLNTVNCKVMVNPALVSGAHDMFICGNDPEAKAVVIGILYRVVRLGIGA